MKVEFTKEWCCKMAVLEAETGVDFAVGVSQPPQAALVPMADDQIISEATEIDCDRSFMQGFERGARFAEAHHGIGVKK